MKAMGEQKKNGDEDVFLESIVFTTAILNFIKAIAELIETLMN